MTLPLRIGLILVGLCIAAHAAQAQTMTDEVGRTTLEQYGIYDTDLLPPSFHAERRATLLSRMSEHTVAIFQASPARTRANDIEYLYHPDADLYYLTGCQEPEAILALSKDGVSLGGKTFHEILFVRRRNAAQETWTGRRLGPEGAMAVLRPAIALPVDTFRSLLPTLLQGATGVFYQAQSSAIKEPLLDTTISSRDMLTASLARRYPGVAFDPKPRQLLRAMRQIKTPPELGLMRKAIAISNEAHNAVIAQARPGWHEYEMQALAEYIFGKSGAEYTAYPCIVGSGPNSTILHYETNRRATGPNEFIEMDMGAEYHGYTADVTRSFPISGSFTGEQRAIYELVLEAQDSGIKACVTGAPFQSAHMAAVRVISSGLKRLGILTDSVDYRRYFMHGTSHYLGLDVHDVGDYSPLAPGTVLTVEPGIYISEGSPCDPKWWNIGCRIEDDILVTQNGPVNLSEASPRRIPDLERLLSQGRASKLTGSN